MSIVRSVRFFAPSIKRTISSVVRITGSRRGTFANGIVRLIPTEIALIESIEGRVKNLANRSTALR